MTPQFNRREAIGTLGILRAAAAVSSTPGPAQASHIELGRTAHRQGVWGRMTGAQAATAALRCEQVPLRLRDSQVPRATSCGTPSRLMASRIFWSPTKARRASWPTPRPAAPARLASSASCPAPGSPMP